MQLYLLALHPVPVDNDPFLRAVEERVVSVLLVEGKALIRVRAEQSADGVECSGGRGQATRSFCTTSSPPSFSTHTQAW